MKKWRWIACVCAILLIISIAMHIYVFSSFKKFMEPNGVNVMGECAHIDLQKKCYILDEYGDAAHLQESVISINGLLCPLKEGGTTGSFSGHAEVAAYPIPFEAVCLWTAGSVDDQFIRITSQYADLMVEDCDRWYKLYILRSNPDVIVVQIFHEDGVTLAVSGETAEEAVENYKTYSDVIDE